MKFSPVLALLALGAPLALPLNAHAQSMDMDAPAASAPVADTPAVAALPMAPKSAATSDAFVWRFMPPVGSRWTMRSFVRATSLTKTPAMGGQKAHSINVKMIQKMTADYDILSRDALGATTIRLTLRDMTTDATLISDGKTVPSPMAEKADPKAIDGATLTIKQSRDGKVWGVVGMRAFQRKLLEANGMDKATINKVLDGAPMTENSEMMKSLSTMSGALPTSPVRVGESWSYDVNLPAPMTLDISGTRTLKSLDSDVAVVVDSASYAGGKSQMKMPKMPGMNGVRVDYSQLTGSVNSISRVQRSSGLPLETTMTQTIQGSISTQMPAMDGAPAQKMTLPMEVTSSARVVLEPR